MSNPAPAPLCGLPALLEVSRNHYDACIDVVEHDLTVDGVAATLRFHHTKFDSNGNPKFEDLAKCLADYIVEYCLSARKRGNGQRPYDYTRLARMARQSLRRTAFAGESGEMLLYFLLESVLGAPQVVAKVDLKTSRKMESHGSDGIHVSWNSSANCLDVFFGEAKLEKTPSSALRRAFNSISDFHKEGMRDFEFGVVTSHFKWLDEGLRASLLAYMNRQESAVDCRVNHACLIGYTWDEYQQLNSVSAEDIYTEFRDRYKRDFPRLHRLLQQRLNALTLKRLVFQVFFLPFASVQEFRNAFNRELS